MEKKISGVVNLSTVLLVKPEGYAMLFRVSTFKSTPFEVFKVWYGLDLFWAGRRVEKLYSMSESGELWWSVPIQSAAMTLLKLGKAKRVKSVPTPEGELPR